MSGFPSPHRKASHEVALGEVVQLGANPVPGDRYLPVGSSVLRTQYPGLSALFPARFQRGARKITLWNKHHPDGAADGAGAIVFTHRFEGTAIVSRDAGMTWSLVSLPNTSQWNGVAWGNGVFSACNNSNTAKGAVSADGLTWTPMSLPSVQQWFRLRFGAGDFVMLTNNSNLVGRSTDGSTWTQAASLPASGQWYAVAYGNGVWAAMRADSTDVAYSTNGGATWTATTRPASGAIYHMDYCNASGLFVAIAYSGNVYLTSPDGVTWTSRTFPTAGARRAGIGYGHGMLVWVEDTTSALTSRDGLTWEAIVLPDVDLTADREASVYSGGIFYMPGMGTASMRIVDPGWESSHLLLSGPTGYHVRVR